MSGRIITPAPPGKCRVCDCSSLKPCLFQIAAGEPLIACSWIDFDHTLCSNFRCIAVIPLDELLEMRFVALLGVRGKGRRARALGGEMDRVEKEIGRARGMELFQWSFERENSAKSERPAA